MHVFVCLCVKNDYQVITDISVNVTIGVFVKSNKSVVLKF